MKHSDAGLEGIMIVQEVGLVGVPPVEFSALGSSICKTSRSDFQGVLNEILLEGVIVCRK